MAQISFGLYNASGTFKEKQDEERLDTLINILTYVEIDKVGDIVSEILEIEFTDRTGRELAVQLQPHEAIMLAEHILSVVKPKS